MNATDAGGETGGTNGKNVLLVCGSLRERSLNRQVGERAAVMMRKMDGSLRTQAQLLADRLAG